MDVHHVSMMQRKQVFDEEDVELKSGLKLWI